MTSRNEQHTARALRRLLATVPPGAECEHSPLRQELFDGLEYWVPELLAAQCDDWPNDLALDGVLHARCRRTGERQIEVLGMAILIREQMTTPLRARLQAAADADSIERFDVRLGERDAERFRLYPLDASAPRKSAFVWAFRAVCPRLQVVR